MDAGTGAATPFGAIARASRSAFDSFCSLLARLLLVGLEEVEHPDGVVSLGALCEGLHVGLLAGVPRLEFGRVDRLFPSFVLEVDRREDARLGHRVTVALPSYLRIAGRSS
jgi:hypothetical protein